MTLQHPIRKGFIDCSKREHSVPLTLEVDVYYVQELLTITQNAGYRPLDWILKENELALRLICQLRLCNSGICVMSLEDLLLLIRQVTNQFGSRRHRCVNGELANRKVIYSFVHYSHTVSALNFLSTNFVMPTVGAANSFLCL